MRAPEPETKVAPSRLLGQLRTRWRAALAIIVAATLSAFFYSSVVLAADPTYRAAATLDISPSRAELDYANSFVRNSPLQSAGVVTQTYAEYILSRPVIASVADEYLREAGSAALTGEQPSPGMRDLLRDLNSGRATTQNPRDAFIDELRESTKVETVSGTYLLRIEVEWDNARLAARFANALAGQLMAEAAARTSGPTARLNQQLADQLAQTRTQLGARLREAARLRSGMGVVDLPNQRRTLIEERVAEEARLTNELAQISASTAQVGALQRQANGKLSATLPAVEQALVLERPRLAGLRESVQQRSARLGQIDGRLARLSGAEARLGSIDLDVQALQTQVAALAERLNTVQLDSLAQGTTVRVVEEARPPLYRDSPKVLVDTALGFIAGSALAGMLLLLAPARNSAALTAPGLPLVPEPRTYPGVLRAPRSRREFGPEESRAIKEKLESWLAEPLRDPSGSILVAAASRDIDAAAVYNLLGGFLRSRGEELTNPVQTGAHSNWALTGQARLLANCGGLAQSGEIPPWNGQTENLVLVARNREDPPAYVEGVIDQLRAAGWTAPYLIRIET
jgi:uncharacterized protein involved in exopolysaccharide biosynthesis